MDVDTQEKFFAKKLNEQMDALSRHGPNLENKEKLTAALRLLELSTRIEADRKLRLTIDHAVNKISEALAS